MRADFLFTLPAAILQPLTGGWLIVDGGIDPISSWIVLGAALYVLAGLCWLPVVWLQIRMKKMLEASVAGDGFDEQAYERLRRVWFLLGWPAFLGLVAVFWLMVAKPDLW